MMEMYEHPGMNNQFLKIFFLFMYIWYSYIISWEFYIKIFIDI